MIRRLRGAWRWGGEPPDRGGQVVGPFATAQKPDEAIRAHGLHAVAVSGLFNSGNTPLCTKPGPAVEPWPEMVSQMGLGTVGRSLR